MRISASFAGWNDITERGRSTQSVIHQYDNSPPDAPGVCGTIQAYADIIIPEGIEHCCAGYGNGRIEALL